MSSPYMSQIEAFAFDFAPRGWLQCNGQLLPINQYQALFALLGTTYGGIGVQTFALPDLRGRLAIGSGTSSTGTTYIEGQSFGEENHTLVQAEVPAHTHAITAVNNAIGSGTVTPDPSVSPGVPSKTGAAVTMYNTVTTGTVALAATGTSGSGQAHSNMMPYLTLTYCISTSGIFPSRN